MTNPYRAMCAELAEEVEHLWSIVKDDNNESHSLAARARALLAQPEPKVPTDWDLKVIMDSVGGPQFDSGPRWMLPFARAVLAKWGHQ